MSKDARDFIASIEETYGQTMGWRTYCSWFGHSSGIIREYGVLLCVVGNLVHYEDFEKQRSLMGFNLPPRSHEPAYEKMSGNFPREDIQDVHSVIKSQAIAWLQGTRTAVPAAASSFTRHFRSLLTMVSLKDGSRLFFEVLDEKDFIRNIVLSKEKENGSI